MTSLFQGDLPTVLQPLSGTMATAIDGFVATEARRFTASSAFKTLWIDANRLAHNTISRVLTGDLDVADLENGQLSINIGDALRTLQQRLVADGSSIASKIDLSGVDYELVLADGAQVAKIEQARNAVGLLHDLVWVLGIGALLAAVGSVLIAPAKGAALKRLGIGWAPSSAFRPSLNDGLGQLRSVYLSSPLLLCSSRTSHLGLRARHRRRIRCHRDRPRNGAPTRPPDRPRRRERRRPVKPRRSLCSPCYNIPSRGDHQ